MENIFQMVVHNRVEKKIKTDFIKMNKAKVYFNKKNSNQCDMNANIQKKYEKVGFNWMHKMYFISTG